MSGTVLGIGDTRINKTEPSHALMEFTVFKSILFSFMLLIFIGSHLLLKELFLPNKLTRGLIDRPSCPYGDFLDTVVEMACEINPYLQLDWNRSLGAQSRTCPNLCLAVFKPWEQTHCQMAEFILFAEVCLLKAQNLGWHKEEKKGRIRCYRRRLADEETSTLCPVSWQVSIVWWLKECSYVMVHLLLCCCWDSFAVAGTAIPIATLPLCTYICNFKR